MMLFPLSLVWALCCNAEGVPCDCGFQFRGIAKGGELTLLLHEHSVTVETNPGELASEVGERLAEALKVGFKRGCIDMPGCAYAGAAIAGTEAELGVLRGPMSLSAQFDTATNEFRLDWEFPTGVTQYDDVFMSDEHSYGMEFLSSPGQANFLSFPLDRLHISPRAAGKESSVAASAHEFLISALTEAVLSSSGCVTLHNGRQYEVFRRPFYRGIAPNWALTDGSARDIILTEGLSSAPRASRRYFQRIASPDSHETFISAMHRRFLNLRRGSHYRVGATFNTLDSHVAGGQWTLLFVVGSGRCDDIAGDADSLATHLDFATGRSKTERLNVIASFGRDLGHTSGKWEEVSTGVGQLMDDIEMPSGEDTLTLFVILRTDSPVEVGFKDISLEDLDWKLLDAGNSRQQ